MNDFEKSLNTKGYYKGYPVMITIRDPKEKVMPLLKKAQKIIDWMEKNEYKPSWNLSTSKEWEKEKGNGSWTDEKSEGEQKSLEQPCEQCGSPAFYRTGTAKSTGKPWKAFFCSEEKSHVKWV
jgi:hypothetical protein